jgi:hypothetical protein
MGTLNKEIRVLSGSTDILLVAPHGLSEDDENTDLVTQQTAKCLACGAIINAGLPRKQLDLNSIPEAERHSTFTRTLKQAIAPAGRTRVVWVHGMKDQSAAGEARKINSGALIHCLIGYGLPDRLTADPYTVGRLATLLNAGGLNTVVAADPTSKFRGHSARNMNQWFRNNRFPLSRVESIQLELSWSGVREAGCISKTARVLGSALKHLISLE